MIIKLYHGSEKIISNPEYGYGKPYNDYGLGFYCTQNMDMAKEWGVTFKRDGYANCYELDTEKITILNLNDEQACVLNWLAVLLENRTFECVSPLAIEAKKYILNNFNVDYKKYDAINGFRADDSYFSYAQDFLNGAISIRQLNNALYLGKLGRQFVLKSKKGFDLLKFVGYEVAEYKEWYAKKELRDKEARQKYFSKERMGRIKGDIYITKILDEEMKSDDKRLRQNLS